MARMTLTNESIVFTPYGIWIQPLLSDGFYYGGPAEELISILVAHPELDIERCQIRVRADSMRYTIDRYHPVTIGRYINDYSNRPSSLCWAIADHQQANAVVDNRKFDTYDQAKTACDILNQEVHANADGTC